MATSRERNSAMTHQCTETTSHEGPVVRAHNVDHAKSSLPVKAGSARADRRAAASHRPARERR